MIVYRRQWMHKHKRHGFTQLDFVTRWYFVGIPVYTKRELKSFVEPVE